MPTFYRWGNWKYRLGNLPQITSNNSIKWYQLNENILRLYCPRLTLWISRTLCSHITINFLLLPNQSFIPFSNSKAQSHCWFFFLSCCPQWLFRWKCFTFILYLFFLFPLRYKWQPGFRHWAVRVQSSLLCGCLPGELYDSTWKQSFLTPKAGGEKLSANKNCPECSRWNYEDPNMGSSHRDREGGTRELR